MKNLKSIFLIIFIVALNHIMVCGQEQSAIHYVVALDCSGSMEGDRWGKALNSVENIQKKVRPIDKFDIVCFAQHTTRIVHDVDSCKIIKHENTCILNAWREAERLFKTEENVHFYLITDGIEDHDDNGRLDYDEQQHNDILKEKIFSFCKNEGGDRQGFYDNLIGTLNNSEKNPIYEALIESNCFHIVADGEFNPKSITFNEADDFDTTNGTYQQTIEYRLKKEIDRNVINDVYATTTNPYFSASIVGNSIKNSYLTLTIKCEDKVPYETTQEKDFYEFMVKIGSSENAKAVITTDSVKVRINFYKEKIVTLPQDAVEANAEWRSECYPPFMARQWPDKFSSINPDTIVVPLKGKIVFNKEAQKSKCEVVLCLIDASERHMSLDEYKVFYGDKEVDSIGFTLTTQDIQDLKVIVTNGTKPGKYSLLVKCKALNGIDRIDGYSNFIDYTYPISFTVNQKKNWGGFVFWSFCALLILIAVIVMIILIVKYIFGPITKEKNRLKTLLKKLDEARGNYNSIISKYELDPIRHIQCGINDLDPMIDVLTGYDEVSFNHTPSYFVCGIFHGNHQEDVTNTVFQEFGLNDYFSLIRNVESEEKNIQKYLKLRDVLQQNERNLEARITERIAYFMGRDMIDNKLVLLKRDITEGFIEAVVFIFDDDNGRWERNHVYRIEDENPLVFEMPLIDEVLTMNLY